MATTFDDDVMALADMLTRGIDALRVRHGAYSTHILGAVVSEAIGRIGRSGAESPGKPAFVFNPDGYDNADDCRAAIKESGKVHMFAMRGFVGTGSGMQMRWYPSEDAES